ncbi:hypothetical protein [Ensifer canadensis]
MRRPPSGGIEGWWPGAQAIAIGGEGRDVTAGGLLADLGWRFAAYLGWRVAIAAGPTAGRA